MQNNVLDYLENIVNIKPDKIAYVNDDLFYSFKNVYDESRSIASYIADRGIYKEPVVVFMNKSPREIVSFLGVIYSGNYYVPIDEEMPASRIELILENVNSKLIICDEETIEKAKKFKYDGEISLYTDVIKSQINEDSLKKIKEKQIDTDPIYIVFTSGSTGVPKGVVACHRSVIDYIEQLSETLEFNENTIFGNQSPLYFDACLKEIYPTLKFGATTFFIPKNLFMFPIKLVEYINEHNINTICWVVSALTMISALGTFKKVVPTSLKNIAFGSEVFPIKQFNLWRENLPEARFTNLYGPTEGTGMCCYYKVNREFDLNESIPIGRPFKNTEIILITEDNKRAADGESGEICIRGTGVTLGYYNNPEKTGEAYVQNPLNSFYPEIIYRTGDIGRINKYGELEFVSRKDFQIKHMGHRIELGEIEANVNAFDEVNLSGCIYDNEKGKIVLYYVGSIETADMISRLKEKLPRYMVPNHVYRLDEMPFTANGKINRVELKNMYSKK